MRLAAVALMLALCVVGPMPCATLDLETPDPGEGSPVAVAKVQGHVRLTPERAAVQLAFVREVIRTPVERLDYSKRLRFLHGVFPQFLLPADRRDYFLKRDEIIAAAGSAQRKTRSFDPDSPEGLRAAGFVELAWEEVQWLIKVTQCSLVELSKHSTLKMIPDQRELKAKGDMRYFIHNRDTLLALIAQRRSGRVRRVGTSSFGETEGSYCH